MDETNQVNPTPQEDKLKFDEQGLLPAIVQDWLDGTVLMLGYMNEEALTKTLATKSVHFWSRSRQTLWEKGETSGHKLLVKELSWDEGKIHAVLWSPRAQSTLLTIPGRIAGFRIVGGSAGDQGAGVERRTISLPAGKDVIIDIVVIHNSF